ncbi:hypothetical protein V8C86DRAFT_2853452 [Haematococcus lacustris]
MSVDTNRVNPLTSTDCRSLRFIAEARLFGLRPATGPDCALNNPPTTGAKVAFIFNTIADATTYWGNVATPSVATTITAALALPCGLSTVTFTVSGFPSESYNQNNLQALQC